MATATDVNIVLGQGNAIKEVHNVRKQTLELNQQFFAQKAEEKKKEDRVRIQEFEPSNKVEIKGDEEKKEKNDSGENKKDSKQEQMKTEKDSPEGSFIDIKI
ncbi:MAG TPA: hypothetical protein VMW42_04875 [Desulfatiglandales bacterium]|nr:hypothetical protein [Desulfatiglandales bacterium]